MVQLVAEGVGVCEHLGGGERAGWDEFVGLGAAGGDFVGEEGEEGGCEGVGGVDDAGCDDAAREHKVK